MSQSEVPLRPILARNLTARADHLVRGNPMIARPESGVGNAHPGLEFDVRTLDRHFLPGLVFDFQYGIGARLVAADPAKFKIAESAIEQGLFLWAVRGHFGDAPGQLRTVRLIGLDGYRVVRQIMDLEPGPVSVVVGVQPEEASVTAQVDAVVADMEGAAPTRQDGDRLIYQRCDGNRARFLDADGVIDPSLLPAGEITQNLCSPWQWDFADCYCFYWASSKPDIVVGISGDSQTLNFQRDRTKRTPKRPAATPSAWMKDNIGEPAMITGWEDLPVVTSEREGVAPRVPRWPLLEAPMSLDEISDRLPELASLEHALCVEYLYAKYSISAPRKLPNRLRRRALRRFQSMHEVFSIAIDEMRHFRWVNEALWLLGKPPTMQRAKVIGRDLRRYFELRPLAPNALDEFIGIEAPSSIYNDDPQQLDGMYTRMLVSLHHLEATGSGPADLVRRLQQLIKVIVDEGESHWDRFRQVKEALAGQAPSAYLRYLTAPGRAEKQPQKCLQELCDAYYDLLLHALYITFAQDRQSRGDWLSISHSVMFMLDEAADQLAALGFGPLFTLPDWSESRPPGFADVQAMIGTLGSVTVADVVPDQAVLAGMFQPSLVLVEELHRQSRRLSDLAARHKAVLEGIRNRMLGESTMARQAAPSR